MPETPQNLKGVTNRPLIDAIPVSHYILPILHIIIGMGNSLVDAFLEWIEERIEVLDVRQVQAQNTIIYATVLHDMLQLNMNHVPLCMQLSYMILL